MIHHATAGLFSNPIIQQITGGQDLNSWLNETKQLSGVGGNLASGTSTAPVGDLAWAKQLAQQAPQVGQGTFADSSQPSLDNGSFNGNIQQYQLDNLQSDLLERLDELIDEIEQDNSDDISERVLSDAASKTSLSLNQLAKALTAFDADNDGLISNDEANSFSAYITELHESYTNAAKDSTYKLLEHADRHGITYYEFSQWNEHEASNPIDEKLMRDLYKFIASYTGV
jgi:Ca2+-binding EF-hand superfamily protein